MAYKVAWTDDDKTILHQYYFGTIEMEDYYTVVRESASMLATVIHPVDIIVDISGNVKKSYAVFMGARYADKFVPDNQRWVVCVGVNPVLRRMIEFTAKLAPKATNNLYFVKTLADAYVLLEEKRAHLLQS